tara:strand:- start:1653 stop:4043 length:2391 start_codon:yes stop_codon:yes gene_type:complete
MKISYSWIKDFLDINLTIDEVAETLTMLGLEAEISTNFDELKEIIVGEIQAIKKHPNADRLNICKVFDGVNTLSVVCGANNVSKGIKIAFSPVDSVLPGNFKIKEAKIRGEISKGMICSERELGISDEHDGIMILDENAICGQSLPDYFSTNNDLITLDITPNRADCFSHLGVARDLAAKLHLNLNEPDFSTLPKTADISSMIEISMDDLKDCPRYVGGIIQNVKIKESPDWLKKKLESVGIRSINNLVDISNYVMMEMGQPTHFFDLDKIKNKKILVRRARDGEKITTLDEIERSVNNDVMLITDGESPIAVAGIMGGFDSAINENTKNVLIECAYFNPTTIRKSSKSLNMITDASKRFERGVDFNAPVLAFWRIVHLIDELNCGEWIPDIMDTYPEKIETNEIVLKKKLINEIAGVNIPNDFVVKTLSSLGCRIYEKDDLTCSPPSWRPDLTRDIDLAEEVIRVYGYDNIKSSNNYTSIMNFDDFDPHHNLDKINNSLIGLGFYQVFNNSLQTKEEAYFYSGNKDLIEMKNPLSDKMTHLRYSLIHGLMQNIEHNFNNGIHDLMLFEHGNTFSYSDSKRLGIDEVQTLTGILHGNYQEKSVHNSKSKAFDYFILKGLMISFFKKIGIKDLHFIENEMDIKYFTYSYSIKYKNEMLGYMGLLSSDISKKFNFKFDDVYAFSIENLDNLFNIMNTSKLFKKIIPYPPIERDLNFVIDSDLTSGSIIDFILSKKFDFLINIVPVSIFKHSTLGLNKKALSLNLIFQSDSKTLEDKVVNPIIDGIIEVVSKKFNAKLR